MPRRKKSTKPEKALQTVPQEQLLIEAVADLPGERVLCTTLGRAQLAANVAAARPDGRVVCHFLDLYLQQLAAEFHRDGPANLSLVCTAEIPADDVDIVAFPTHSGGEAELTRDYLQCGFQALVDGGRLAVSTNNPKDSWLHEQMQTMFTKVTRIADAKRGVVYIGRKSGPLKKVKNFTCEFAFRDSDNLIKAVSRPGVFSHRRLDPGARALLKVTQIRDGDKIIDMGCGSGTVGLALAARNPQVSVTAIDSNARAVQCTEQGRGLNGLSNLQSVHSADGECAGKGSFDLLLGNPPYFSNYRIAELFLQTARRLLKPGGELMIVCKNPAWYRERMGELFDDVGFAQSGNYHVVSGINRRRRKRTTETRRH